MPGEHTGAVVKRLRREAGLSQRALADAAGITERWLRAWECGHKEPSEEARGWVAEALARALGRPLDDVRREMGNRRAAPPERAQTPPFVVDGADVAEAVRRVLVAALDGFRTGPFLHHRPSLLRHDREGSLFLMERHNDAPSVADLRTDWVVVYVRWTSRLAGVTFEAPAEKEEGAPLPDTGPLPGVGVAHNHALTISDAALDAAAARWPKKERPSPLRARVLVTPLCRERTSPSVPKLLSDVLHRDVPGGPATELDFVGWLDLAQSLATGLWSLHASGWAHLGVAAENVLLRVDHGVFRDITLFNVWDRGRLEDEPSRAMRTDLFDLGTTLASALAGRDVEIDPEELRPPDFGARERLKHLVHGEMNRRALNLCLRYLLETSPPRARAGPDEPQEPGAGDEPSSQILMKLIHEIGALRALHRRRGIAQAPSRLPSDPSGRPSLPPGSSERGPTSPLGKARGAARPERPDAISSALTTLSRLTEANERKDWCDRYVARGELPGGAGGPGGADVDAGAELLARGHGRSAGSRLLDIAERRAEDLPPEEAAKLLRLLVGVLLPREGAGDVARRTLDLFWRTENEELFWWVMLLEQRVLADGSPNAGAPVPPWRETGNAREDARARVWELAHRYFVELRRGKALSGREVSDITRLLHGESAHEAIYGALLLARAGSRERTFAGLRRGIQSVLLAASYAATKAFPHEYAAALALGATLTRAAARDPALGRELEENGVDVDACLVLASECDLQAAEVYQWLDVPIRSCQALSAAADCLFLCRAPEWTLHGFRWLSLARNQRLLPWSPPDLLDEDMRERGFSGPRFTATGRVFEEGEDSALERGVELWWSKTGTLGGAAERRDPGAALADDYYALYGPGIEWAFGTGSVSIEPLSAAEDGELSPSPGGTVRALFEMARRELGVEARPGQRVLDVGCGAGADALLLASQGFDVVGIDSSAWSIERAEERARGSSGPGRARFVCGDASALDARALGLEEQFDWVLLRDSLGHFVQKRRVLSLAVTCAKPGGAIIGCDWIQKRTATRWAWWRLFETVWYAALEGAIGLERLLLQARPSLVDVRVERRDDAMRAFFEHRLAWVTAAAQSPASSTDETAVRLRARSDIAAMCDLAGPAGPVGWSFFVARRAGQTVRFTEGSSGSNVASR